VEIDLEFEPFKKEGINDISSERYTKPDEYP
jgi:hypothetical protein